MLYLLLPAHNEGREIGPLLEDIQRQGWSFPYRIVLVDDGSTDNTRAVAQQFVGPLPLVVVRHHTNLGLGCAMAHGIETIRHHITFDDVLVTMDADHTHPVELVPAMRDAVLAGSDVVVASRFCAGGRQIGLSLFRRTLSRCAAFVSRSVWHIPGITDYTSGYRAYRGSVVRRWYTDRANPITQKGFAVTLELLLRSVSAARLFGELPLVLRYDRKVTKSKMNVPATVLQYLRLMCTIKLTK